MLAAVQNCGVTPTTFAQHFTFRSELRQKGVDISEAVQAAQDAGRRITLAHPKGVGVARSLRHLVDSRIVIPVAELEKILPPR